MGWNAAGWDAADNRWDTATEGWEGSDEAGNRWDTATESWEGSGESGNRWDTPTKTEEDWVGSSELGNRWGIPTKEDWVGSNESGNPWGIQSKMMGLATGTGSGSTRDRRWDTAVGCNRNHSCLCAQEGWQQQRP